MVRTPSPGAKPRSAGGKVAEVTQNAREGDTGMENQRQAMMESRPLVSTPGTFPASPCLSLLPP